MKILPQASPYTLKSNAGQFRPGFLRPKQLFTVLLGALLPFAATRASAQNGVDTWVGNTSANWAGANWSGANNPPISGDGLTFGAAGTAGASLIDNLTTGSGFVITNITYSAAAPSYLITSGGGGFTLGTSVAGPVIVQGSANAQTNNDPITLAGPQQGISLTGNLTLGGVITGTGGLSQTGSGTLTLTGNNTYTGSFNGIAGSVIVQSNGAYAGGFTVSGGGSLTFASNVVLNSGTYAAAINNGGTLNFNNGVVQTISSVIAGSGTLNFSGGAASNNYILNGASTFTGNLNVSNAYVSVRLAGALGVATAGETYTINSNGIISLDIGNILGGGASLIPSTFIINQGGVLQATAINTFNNNVIGNLVFNGGTMQTVNNVGNTAFPAGQYNSYELGGTVTAGGPFVAPSLMTMISPGADPSMNLGVNNAAGFQSVWTVNLAGVNPLSLPDLTCGIRLVNSGNSQNAAGIIKLGTGTLALTVTNAFSGPITVSNGTFEISGGGQLLSGAVTFNITNEATFEFNGTASQTFSGPVFQNDGTLLIASGTPSFSGPITNSGTILVTGGSPLFAGIITNTGTIQVPAGAPLFSGTITNTGSILVNGGSPQFTGPISGTSSFTNNGPGTATLSGSNSYTGNTTANGGLLVISAKEPSTGPVFVNDGAILGILSSGSSHFSPSTLNLGSSTGAVVQLVLSSTTQAQLTPASIVVVGSNAVVISGNLQPNTSYPVLTVNAGSQTGVGTLNFVVPNGVGGSVTTSTALGVTTYTLNTTTVTSTIWDSAVNGTWDINTTANWLAPSSGTKYLDNSPVQFDDNPADNTGGLYVITNLAATKLSPSFVHVTNNTTGYTFSNTVVIGGSTGVTKDGAGSFTVYGMNSYTGPTVINAGNVIAAGPSVANVGGPLGNNSSVTLANAASAGLTLTTNNAQIASLIGGGATGGNVNLGSATLTFGVDNSSQTYAGIISGAGSLTQGGSGTNTLTGVNTYTGTTTISSGALNIGGSGLLSAATKIVNNGVFNYNSSANFTNTAVNTGTGAWNVNGTGILTLGGTSTFTGNMVVNGGILSDTDAPGANTSSGLGNPSTATRTVTINNGAILSLDTAGGNEFGNGAQFPAFGFIVNQGSMIRVTSGNCGFGPITLNGGTLSAQSLNSGQEYNSMALGGNITVIGTTPSVMTSINGLISTGFNLGVNSTTSTITFNVTNTGAGGPDLTVSASLVGGENETVETANLTKTGTGTMALAGTNAYTGNTTISAGTLLLTNGGNLNQGTYPGNIINNSIFNDSSVTLIATSQTINGAISGTGTNIVNGAGVQLTLAGTNTVTGPTIISGGTLFLTGTATLGNISSLTITNGGVFDVSQLAAPLYTLNPTETLIASNVSGTPAINGSLATVSGSKFYVGGTNSAGILGINGSLSLALGTSVPFDLSTLSTSDGGVNDQVVVNGALTIATGNSLTLSALGGAANLDQTSDYILFTGTSLVGGFSPGPIWSGTLPANYNHFIITNDVTHSQVRLIFSSVAVPSISLTATTPSSGILRNQPILLSVTVVQGGAPITGVSINLSSVGGAASVPLTLSSVAGVYTNTVTVPPGTLAGVTLLPVTATDSNNNQGSGNVVVSIVASTETWNGGGTAGQENFDNNSNWAIEGGESAAYAPGYVGDLLTFAGLGGTAGFVPVMDNSYNVRGVVFSSGATNFNITAANSSSLTLSGGITNSSTNLQTVAVPIILSASENINPGTGGLVLSGAISSGAPTAGLIENGPGTLTLSGNDTSTGQTIVNSGTLNLTSSGNLETNDVTLLVGGVANSNAVLNTAGNITNSSIWIGVVTNGIGAVYQTAGNIVLNPLPTTGFNDLQIGDVSGSYGYYNAAGGTLTAYGICIGGDGNNTDNTTLEGNGMLDINGGIVNDTGNTFYTVMNHCTATSAQISIINLYSGSLTYGGVGGLDANWGGGETSIINVMGGSLLDAGQNPIELNESGNAANTGILNLIGGFAQTSQVLGANGQINFNGGTLVPSEGIANFIVPASALVYSHGGTISNNGSMITNAAALINPSSNGLASITTFTGGAGYIAPPFIRITNGGGTGATAIAQINPATGTVTNIIITSPGINYTNSPTFVFSGGGATTQASVTASTIAPNTGGTMTFSGSGYTILTGASTYTNTTIVNGIDLQLGATGSINNSAAILVTNSGYFDLSLLSSFTLGSGQRFEGSGGYVTSPTGAPTIAGSGSSIYPGTDGTIGVLNFNGNLTMAIGSTANFDLSTSSSGANDSIIVNSGTLTLNGNAFHIKAPSPSANLDTGSDYALITASSVVGGFSPTPIWDVQPANAAGFRVLTLTGNKVVLRYSTSTPPTGGGTATPSTVVRNGSVFISVTVTNGSNPMSPGGNVTIDTSLIGGSFGQSLFEVGATAVWTNTFAIPSTAPPANAALAVTITDNGGQIGVAFVTVNLTATTETWNGLNQATDQNWDDGKNWVSTVPPGYAGDNLVFAGSTGLAPVVDQSYSPHGIAFASGASAFVLTNGGSGTLTMTAGSSVTNSSATTQTFGLPVNLSGAATFNAVSGNLLLAQPLGELTPGGGIFVSAGPGTNILIANNSYTGGTTISSGTLQLADPGLLNTGTYASPMTDNAVFLFSSQQPQTMSGVISGSGGIVVNGGGGGNTNGILTLSGANTFTGNLTVSNGTLVDGNEQANGNPVAGGFGNAQTAGKTVTIGTNGVVNLASPGGNDFGYGGVVPAIAFVVNQGGLLEATTLNVQINTVTLNGGTLLAGSGDNSLQYPTLGIGGSITSGGAAQSVITNLSGDVNRDYVSLGDGAGAGFQEIFTVAPTGSGGADLAIGAQLTDSGSAVYGTVFTGLIKAGAGNMLLAAQNVYQGTTTLSNGIISLGAGETAGTSGPLGNSAASNPGSIVFAGGTLQYSSVNQNDYSGRFSVAANQLVSIDLAGQPISFATPLVSSGGSLTVVDSVGGGNLTLGTTNTYTGLTTISNTSLILTSTGSISNTSGIRIGPGATFNATAIPAYVLGANGSITGSGNASPANFAVGTSVNFGNRPITLNYDGTHSALTISSGTLTLNSNAFTVNGLPLPVGGPYVVANQTSGNITSFGSYTVTGTAINPVDKGTITVVNGQVLLNIAAITPPTVTFSINGNNTSISITWPGAYLGASLLYLSNSLPTGINTNIAAWTVVPGSTAVTNEVISIGRTNEVFFRLNYP